MTFNFDNTGFCTFSAIFSIDASSSIELRYTQILSASAADLVAKRTQFSLSVAFSVSNAKFFSMLNFRIQPLSITPCMRVFAVVISNMSQIFIFILIILTFIKIYVKLSLEFGQNTG